MKQKIKFHGIVLIIAFFFSSCTNPFNFGFDVYELAHFRKNGSGKFELIFSLDRATRLIKLGEYVAQDHMEFVRLLIQDAFLATGEILSKIPGITKVTNVHDDNMLYFKLTFEFNNMQALNNAMWQININVDPPDVVYFKMNDRAFARSHTQGIAKLVEYYQSYDDSLTKSFDLSFFFRNMRYIIRYSFAKEIRKITNPLATLAKDKKSITIIQNIFDPKEKDLLKSNIIYFKTANSKKATHLPPIKKNKKP